MVEKLISEMLIKPTTCDVLANLVLCTKERLNIVRRLMNISILHLQFLLDLD